MINLSGTLYRRTLQSIPYPKHSLYGYPQASWYHRDYCGALSVADDLRGGDRGEPPWGPRPLRIAHVGQSLVRAGVEQWLKALIRFLDPRWAQVVRCVVTEEQLVDPEVAIEVGVSVEIGRAAEVRRAARECDVLLCWGPADVGQWLTCSRAPLTLFIAHGEGIWTRQALEGCLPVLDHVVAVSSRVRDRICPYHTTTVIHNGVDTRHLATSRSRRQVRQSLGFTEDDFVLGFVGRFSPEKRAHALIEATALLPARFKALLVGWGPLEEELRGLADSCLGGRCAFVMGRDYVGDYYQAMDALCMVSEAEGFCMAALEGMMCGVPLIATPVGFISEAIQDRINGLVIPGTIASICEAAELLVSNPAWARGLAMEGQAYAREDGHARSMAIKYESLIAQLWQAQFSCAQK